MSNVNERNLVKDTVLSVGLVAIAMAWIAVAAGSGAVQASERFAARTHASDVRECAGGAPAPASHQSAAARTHRAASA